MAMPRTEVKQQKSSRKSGGLLGMFSYSSKDKDLNLEKNKSADKTGLIADIDKLSMSNV